MFNKLIFSIGAISWAVTGFGASLYGTVVSVSDGDTITVLDKNHVQYKVRLSGIDAPEKKQAFGQQSKANMAKLVFNRSVQVEWKKKDRYQRLIGKVLAPPEGCMQCTPTIDVGMQQLSDGMAWWYRHYAIEQEAVDRRRYEAAEEEAKSSRRGLWKDPSPVAPWEWRHQEKSIED